MKKISVTYKDETREIEFTDTQASIMERIASGEKVDFNDDTEEVVWSSDRKSIGNEEYKAALDKVFGAFGLTSDEDILGYVSQFEIYW